MALRPKVIENGADALVTPKDPSWRLSYAHRGKKSKFGTTANSWAGGLV